MKLYKKITRAEYSFPQWFMESQKKLISGILDPNPKRRLTITDIIENEWFQKDYVPTCGNDSDEKIYLDDVNAAFKSIEENIIDSKFPKSLSCINAFQLIAMSNDLDLSGLFEEHDDNKHKVRLGSQHTISETIKIIEAAAMDVSLSVARTNNFKIKMHAKQGKTRFSLSYIDMSAEVIEVAPTHCVVEISRSAGQLRPYNEFCKSLTSQLTEESGDSSHREESEVDHTESDHVEQNEGTRETKSTIIYDGRGYSSS